MNRFFEIFHTTALLSLLVLPLVGCGGDGPSEAAETTADEPAERSVLVSVVDLQPESAVDRLSLPADLQAERRAVLAAEIAGSVEGVTVDDGDAVARGQVLASVDTRSIRQQLAEAEALDRQAQLQLERASNLFERRSITKKDMLDARTNADVAQARLSAVRLELSKSQVSAPWSGLIADKRVEVGDYVVPGQGMFELVDVSRLKVTAPVPSADVPFVAEGEPVTIRVSSLPGEEFSARVTRLAAELDQGARTLELEAELPNPDGRLKPGMLARIEIARRSLPSALMVPMDAVVDLESSRVVYVVEDGRAARRTVQLGPVIGDRVVVEGGLAAGDLVIVEGQSQVAPGQPVEIAQTSATSRGPTASEMGDLAGGRGIAAPGGAGAADGEVEEGDSP